MAAPSSLPAPLSVVPSPVAEPDHLALIKALERKVLWLSLLDDPQRQPSAAQPRRAQGRRPPGVVRLGGDGDDRALFRRAAARRTASRSSRTPARSSTPSSICSATRRATSSKRFRALGGAQSYPSRTKDGDDVDFSTGSVGLGVAMTLFASLVQDYVRLKGLAPDEPAGRAA